MALLARWSDRVLPATLLPLLVAAVVAACAGANPVDAPNAASALRPGGKSNPTYILPLKCTTTNVSSCVACDPDTDLCGTLVADATPRIEILAVCKYYAGGASGPAVDVNIHAAVSANNTHRFGMDPNASSYDFTAQIQPNTCLQIWKNGEQFGPDADVLSVTEVVPAGYTTSSQLSTLANGGSVQTSPATSSATVSNIPIGGPNKPGATVVFTNTAIPNTGSIGDFAWIDANGNGKQDSGEPGLAGVTLTLSGAGSGSQTTGGSGAYAFTALGAGSYTVTASAPAGWVPTSIGALGTTSLNDNNANPSSTVLVGYNGSDQTVDFGFVPQAGSGQGCTPGYWKQPQHAASWHWYGPNDPLDGTFGVTFTSTAKGNPTGPLTLLQALGLNGNTGGEALFRIGTAALLNAVYQSGVSYPYTAPDVILMVRTAWQTHDINAMNATKDILDAANNQLCPLN